MRSIVQLSLSSRSPPRTFRTHGRTPPPSSIDGGPTPRWWNMLKMVSIIPHYLTSKIYILRDIKLKITLLIFICIFHYYIGIFILIFIFTFQLFCYTPIKPSSSSWWCRWSSKTRGCSLCSYWRVLCCMLQKNLSMVVT